MQRTDDKSEDLPKWQIQLIEQILNLFAAYYCLPEEVKKNERRLALEEGFRKINQEFKISNQADSNFLSTFFGSEMPAGEFLEKSKFIEKVNEKILLPIDAHFMLAYNPDLISRDSKRGKGIIFDTKRQSAYFDAVTLPTEPSQDAIDLAIQDEFGFRSHPPEANEDFISMYSSEKDKIKEIIPNESHVTIPDDIGYVRINAFHPHSAPRMKEKAHDLMRPMLDKKAIILDLRYHVGGDPRMVEEFVSYFFQETGRLIDTLKLVDTLKRYLDQEEVEEYRIVDQPFKLLKVPVYILISEVTCSAGESLAYNLQQMGLYGVEDSQDRFTLIGQTTAGGGHSWYIFPLVDFSTSSPTVNKELLLWVPIRLNENAFSHTNWQDQPEGKGVHPDIEIEPNHSALEKALELIKQDNLLKDHTAKLDSDDKPSILPGKKL